MVQRRLVLVLVLATAVGLITSYVVYQAVEGARGQQAEIEEIVVAGANISMGEAVTPQHVKLAQWPKSTVPSGAMRAVKDADGRVARASMVVGEPVLDAKLALLGQGGLMPVLVPSGKRAVSIVVEQAVQKSGFVVPNSRIDVVVTMARKSGESKESRLVLQDVMVLASDQTVELKDNKPVTMTTVTVAVSPEEAERLALAQNEGKVTLALRNVQDTARISTPGVTTAQLMGTAVPATAPVKKAASASSSSTKRALKPAVAATTPPPLPSVTAPEVQPSVPTHTVSVIRGVAETETVFTRDPERGWLEKPGKAGTTKRP